MSASGRRAATSRSSGRSGCPAATAATLDVRDSRGPEAAPTEAVAVAPALPADEWRVYIVRCADDSLYTGVAKDLHARIARHNSGAGARYTRGRLPVELVYTERAENRSRAQCREAQIKKLTPAAKRALIAQARRR